MFSGRPAAYLYACVSFPFSTNSVMYSHFFICFLSSLPPFFFFFDWWTSSVQFSCCLARPFINTPVLYRKSSPLQVPSKLPPSSLGTVWNWSLMELFPTQNIQKSPEKVKFPPSSLRTVWKAGPWSLAKWHLPELRISFTTNSHQMMSTRIV